MYSSKMAFFLMFLRFNQQTKAKIFTIIEYAILFYTSTVNNTAINVSIISSSINVQELTKPIQE